MKKILYAVYQIAASQMLILNRSARWCWRSIEGDWLEDRTRRKYWISAAFSPELSDLWVEFDGKPFPILESPQTRFFDQLARGTKPEATEYFNQCRNLYDEATLKRLFSRYHILYNTYKTSNDRNIPVASFSLNKRFVVEDGAHRLALMASRGTNETLVGLAFWSHIPER